MECGIFLMGYMVSTTITVHFRFISKLIAPSQSVHSNIVLYSVFSVILPMVIFVSVYVFLEQIMYFAPQMWREDRIQYMFSGMLLLLRYIFLAMMVSHKCQSSRRTILGSSQHFFLSQDFNFCSFLQGGDSLYHLQYESTSIYRVTYCTFLQYFSL